MWIILSLSITHVKWVVLCGYSVKFVNYSCKVVVVFMALQSARYN
jgi:hypothetical protein